VIQSKRNKFRSHPKELYSLFPGNWGAIADLGDILGETQTTPILL
jgi:hypothetical protein